MSNKRLDKLFKDKLSHRDFDYQDSYWTGFEKDYFTPSGTSAGGSILRKLIGSEKLSMLLTPVIIISALTIYTLRSDTTTNSEFKEKTTLTSKEPSYESKTLVITDEVGRSVANPNSTSITHENLVSDPKDFDSNPGLDESIRPQTQNEFPADMLPALIVSANGISPEINQAQKATLKTPDLSAGQSIASKRFDNNLNPTDANSLGAAGGAVAINSTSKIENNTNNSFNRIERENQSKEEFSIHQELTSNNSLTLHSQEDWNSFQTDSTLKSIDTPLGAYLPFRLKPVYAISGHVGMAWVSKELKAIQPEYANVSDYRNNYESQRTAVISGLDFQTRYRGFTLNTGVHFMKWGETINYLSSPDSLFLRDTLIVETIDNSYWEPVFNDSMLIDSIYIQVIDTSISQITDTVYYEPGNTLGRNNGKTVISYVEIPLLIGYEKSFENVILGAYAGVSVGFLTYTTNYYVNETISDLIPINTGYAVIRKNIFNLNLGLNVGYHLGSNLDLFLSGGYKRNLQSVFTEKALDQKYQSFSTSIRLRYTF